MAASLLLAAAALATAAPQPRAAVAMVMARGRTLPPNSYLLVRRHAPPDEGKWSLTYGPLEPGEGTVDGAVRIALD